MPSLKRIFFLRLYYFAAQTLAFFINFTCEYSASYILFDIMASQTQNQSVAITRLPLFKPGRPFTIKGRMC
jgi:hypothetical protein